MLDRLEFLTLLIGKVKNVFKTLFIEYINIRSGGPYEI